MKEPTNVVKDTSTTTDQAALVEPEVNAPAMVTVFAPNGDALTVPQAAADTLIREHGFKRNKFNVDEAVSTFQALFAAGIQAIQAYVAGVKADGFIDTSDVAAQVTAKQAMREIEIAFDDLCLEVSRQFPVRQGDSVPLVEQRATITLEDGSTVEMSLLELASRKVINPNNPLYAEANVVYGERMVSVDPSQVERYLSQPGWREAK